MKETEQLQSGENENCALLGQEVELQLEKKLNMRDPSDSKISEEQGEISSLTTKLCKRDLIHIWILGAFSASELVQLRDRFLSRSRQHAHT